MNRNKTRLLYCSLLWLISLAMLAWCEWPVQTITREIVFLPGRLIITPSVGIFLNPINPPAFPEERRLILEWTPILRKGDMSKIILNFVGERTPILDNSTSSSIRTNFENVYDIYSINAEARMELDEMEVNPQGLSGHVLAKGQDVHFTWDVKPETPGISQGTAWFYLKLFPKNGNESFEQAISAQTVSIKVISLLGLNSNFWRILSVIGLIGGFVILKFENIKSTFYSKKYKLAGKAK